MQETPVESIPAPKPSANTTAMALRNAGGGFKETIEQILIAFILAFVFRAFVVEAFVIPTGSMATTLMGAHTRFQCPDCGYNFDVNYSNGNGGDDSDVPSNAGMINSPIFCPNCGFAMDRRQTSNPPVFFGDRILVLKYLYLFQKPKRWDVVVFKAPVEPQKYNYSQNYIKRLVGRPGETVMVLDGDIYVKQPGESQYHVQTKPLEAQQALWRLVYDNDYRPQQNLDRGDFPNFKLPWTTTSGTNWNLNDTDHGRTFTFADAGSGTLQFDPQANPTSQNILDYLAFDQPRATRRPEDGFPGPYDIAVSDLDLRATYQRSAGDGPLELRLTKRDKTFIARITPTQVTLLCETNGRRTTIGSPVAVNAGSRPIRIELSNADYEVTLRIDDETVSRTTSAQYAPDVDALLREYQMRSRAPLARVEISAEAQHCRLSHLSLWRDVFYYNHEPNGRPLNSGTPDAPAVLGPDEYFVCGDNSLVSYDARYWPESIHLPDEKLDAPSGRVPDRFLLGKAFFVYWPAGYRPFSSSPNLIPNFADMRFIH